MREYATTNSDRLLSRGGLLSRHSEVSHSSTRHHRNIKVNPNSTKHRRNIRGSHNNIRVNLKCIRAILILWLSRIRISSTDSLRIRVIRSTSKLRRHSIDSHRRLSTGSHHHHRSTAISRLKRDLLSSAEKRKDPTWHQSSCSG